MEQFRIGEIEEILLNAFPSIDREIYDGWILNFSGAYTYRANCIYPFYSSNYDLEEKIQHCEEQYRELFLPAVYKMTSSVPHELDQMLENKGYQIVKYVDVLYRSLEDWKENDCITYRDGYEIITMSQQNEEWLDGVNHLIGIPYPSMEKIQKRIFRRIRLPIICVMVKHQGKVIGTGLGVIERRYVGLYAIHVHKKYRRRGLAEIICSNIMSRGKKMGADKAHLQVRRGNEGAFLLYEKLGMRKIYSQWFRMKSWPESKKIFD
ncbi:GNAT family N-acetyltransferase [Frisingicoccus sp.]|uniref:GNAT family N-acetyltransferase n=1 Tax=Frisingicoccus sp. TaxID=1918627 RepID=UPI002A82D026|nr:GNAT family N-acetyltransferase [Frisingicoccus sp.]MDY4922094.1 GNAT family N-acetyltransferase [Frisingicoccus sp.]